MKRNHQNQEKEKNSGAGKRKDDIQLQLSSDEQRDKIIKNMFFSKEDAQKSHKKQMKFDLFLDRVKNREEMKKQQTNNSLQNRNQVVTKSNVPFSRQGLSRYQFDQSNREKQRTSPLSRQIFERPYQKNITEYFREKKKKQPSPEQEPINLRAYYRERAEKDRKKYEQLKQKKERRREIQRQNELKKKKERGQTQKMNLSAIFDLMGSNPKEKQPEKLKNIEMFDKIDEEMEFMKGMVIEDQNQNKYKRTNAVVKKMRLQAKQKIPSAFIRLLLGYQFTRQFRAPETKRVPNIFEDQMTYKKTFHYLVTNQCIADIHARMKKIEETKVSSVPIQILCYRKNTEGMVEFMMNEIGVNQKFNENEKEKFALKNFSLSKNRLGIVTNAKKFSLENFGFSGKNNKIYAFLCLLVTPQTKQDLSTGVRAIANFQIPNFQLILKTIKTKKAYFYDLQKISTHLRQYTAISNSYDSEISSFIYNPSIIEKNQLDIKPEFERQKLEPMLERLKNMYNQTQYESIRQMSIRESGIVLLQGPPGTGKTTTLMGLIAAQYYYLKQILNDDEKQKILICAPSNAAVDHITKRLVNEGLVTVNGQKIIPNILRVGLLQTDDKDVRSVYLDDLCERDVKKQKNDTIKKNNMTTIQVKQKLLSLTKQRKKLINIPETDRTLDYDVKEQKILTQMRRYQSMLYEHRKEKIQLKKLYHCIQTRRMEEADIILTTLSSSGSDKIERLRGFFGCLIVDEAAQSTQPNLLIPLQTGVKKVLLVGDPCQLPSTTISQDSAITLFNRSLFQRFLDTGLKPYFLNIQYRMAPKIRQFSSNTFYSNRLLDDKTIQQRYNDISKTKNHPLETIVPFCGRNALFIDVKQSQEELFHNSYQNIEQAKVVKEIVLKFLKSSSLSIGIITPYQSQRKYLINQLKTQIQKEQFEDNKVNDEVEEGEEVQERNGNKNQQESSQILQRLMINTVDSFQGQQKDIIIVSMVRSNDNGGIGFMKDERRINVALTRSRHLLIVVGNGDTLGSNEIWDKFLTWTQKNQLYYPLENPQERTTLLGKVFKSKYRNSINRKKYKNLSVDERKQKREEIKRADFNIGQPKKRVKKEKVQLFEQVRVEEKRPNEKYHTQKADYNINIDQSKLIIEQKRQKQLEGTSYEDKIKKMKEIQEQLMNGSSGLSQLFKM